MVTTRLSTSTVIGLTAGILLCAGVLQRWVCITRAGHALAYAPLSHPLSEIPVQIGPYVLERNLPLETDVLRVANVDSFINRVYMDPTSGTRLQLYIGYWARENVGMGHGPEACYPAVGWRVEREPTERIVRFDRELETVEATIALHRFSHAEPEGIVRRAVGFTAVASGAFLASSRGMYWHRPGPARRSGSHFLAQVQVAGAVPNGVWETAESDIVTFMKSLLPHVARCLPQPPGTAQPEDKP